METQFVFCEALTFLCCEFHGNVAPVLKHGVTVHIGQWTINPTLSRQLEVPWAAGRLDHYRRHEDSSFHVRNSMYTASVN
jgi:hypothetical protein